MAIKVIGSIDPGIRDCGIALFHDQTLIWGRLVKNPMRSGNDYNACRAMAQAVTILFPRLDELVIEWPRIFTAGKQIKNDNWADPNDLLPLVGVGAAVAMSFPEANIVRVYPDEWKGQVEKIAMNMRTMIRLTSEERKNVDAKDPDPDKPHDKGHNVWDGVGIGLHRLGRLDRVRVIPR
jgi:hypothetical protein